MPQQLWIHDVCAFRIFLRETTRTLITVVSASCKSLHELNPLFYSADQVMAEIISTAVNLVQAVQLIMAALKGLPIHFYCFHALSHSLCACR